MAWRTKLDFSWAFRTAFLVWSMWQGLLLAGASARQSLALWPFWLPLKHLMGALNGVEGGPVGGVIH